MIKTDTSLEGLEKFSANTMPQHIGIKVTKLESNKVHGTMPVDSRTHQPMGILHGGASAAFIETLGSVGSALIVDTKEYAPVGLEVNANHVRGVKSGLVYGTAEIVHCGKKTHVWKVDVTNEAGKLVCTGRLTVMIVPIEK
ncbi:MAG: hotdog fold thioesterase [Flavobacteriales bacterium]|nr:hotdog fold thioesterase [Flavobacteriales bacterium]